MHGIHLFSEIRLLIIVFLLLANVKYGSRLLATLLCNSFFQDFNCYHSLTMWTALFFEIFLLSEPFEETVIVEDVSATWNLSNRTSVLEFFHANSTISYLKLINGIVLFVFDSWNQLFILLD